ncbi:hypothetical protein PVW46_24635 [Mameliella sp. AT18]|uniref:hypothetical protein n=1 Tax=Mameliella sp. AT18 TaxID=3028385 RepID=UPI00237BE04C|nr:hypothetical protein [Mameliella sp. AT18]MDD9733100.1 hypothetical protein [Mameliella sp. AT18]
MAIEIGVLRALLSLDSAAFDKGTKRAKASMGGLQRSLSAAADSMGRVGRKLTTRVTLPLVGIAGAAVKSSLATVDAQSKMAQSLGTSTRSIQILTRAADRAGISTGELEQISRQLTKRLSEAAAGGGPAAKALDRLGISVSDLADMDLDQKILKINKAIEDNVPAAERAAVATAIFGSRAGLVAGRLDPATIAAAAEEMEKFGVTVTELEADRIEEANDAISALGLVSRGLGNQLAVALAPVLKSIAETLADWAAKFSRLEPRTQAIVAGVAAFAAAAGPLALGLGFVATGLAALATPIGLVVVGLAAVAGAAAYVVANWDEIQRDYPATASALEKVGAAGLKIGEGWADAIKRMLGATEAALTSGIKVYDGLVKGDFASVFEGLKGIVSAAIESAIANLDLFTLGGASRIRDGLTQIYNVVTENGPDMVRQGKLIVEWIKAGIETWLHKIGDAMSGFAADIVAEIKAAATGVVEAAKKLGRDLIMGIPAGIAEKIGEVQESVRAAVNSLFGVAKKEARVESPSKRFMEFGRFLMDGVRIGIDEKAPEAADAAGRAAEAAAKAFEEVSGKAKLPSGVESAIGTLSNAMGQAASSAQSMGEAVRGAFRQIASQWVSSGINSILTSLAGFLFQGFGGGGGLLGEIFGGFKGFFADGGVLGAGQWGIAGEAGPEPVVGPARIIPNHALGGGPMTFNIDARGAQQGVGDEIAMSLRAEIRRLRADVPGMAVSAVKITNSETPL